MIFVISIMRTNEGPVQKIENKKKTSESYLYSSRRNTTNKNMTNKKRFRHNGKPKTKNSIYIF